METKKPKIRLKGVFRDKLPEDNQLTRHSSAFSRPLDSSGTEQLENGFIPVVSNSLKRKRAHKSGVKKEELQNYMSSEDAATSLASFQNSQQRFPGYVDNSKEKRGLGKGIEENYLSVVSRETARHIPEESRSEQPVQIREGTLKVRLKSRKLTSDTFVGNQIVNDLQKDPNMAHFSSLPSESADEDLKKEYKETDFRQDNSKTESGLSGSKSSNAQLGSARYLDSPITPVHMRGSRSSDTSTSSHLNEANRSHLKLLPHNKYTTSFNSIDNRKSSSSPDRKELETSLAVIGKIMRMDAAEPFNTPVDPISLGIPDYFDIIHTPMDFGTIRHELEYGDKYKNSEDVFRDVQLIWDNCSKYNRKGDAILDLMKRVKKNFAKYWCAAGLFYESQKKPNVQSIEVGPESINGEDPVTNYEKLSLLTEAKVLDKIASQNVEQASGTKNLNNNRSDTETAEVGHSSGESEIKMTVSQSPHLDTTMKKRGLRVVLKKSSGDGNLKKDSSSVDEIQAVQNGAQNESQPKVEVTDATLQEQADQLEAGIVHKSRRKNIRHKPGCLCAVCVALRRKYAREEKIEQVTIPASQAITNNTETSNEHGIEVEGDTGEVQGQEEVHPNENVESEKLQPQNKLIESHGASVDHHENSEKKDDKTDKDPDGVFKSVLYRHAKQSPSPEILSLCNSLLSRNSYSRWSQHGSVNHHPAESQNPFAMAMSSFLK